MSTAPSDALLGQNPIMSYFGIRWKLLCAVNSINLVIKIFQILEVSGFNWEAKVFRKFQFKKFTSTLLNSTKKCHADILGFTVGRIAFVNTCIEISCTFFQAAIKV
jgi:hypothetical protein